jgi:hypothetical protein
VADLNARRPAKKHLDVNLVGFINVDACRCRLSAKNSTYLPLFLRGGFVLFGVVWPQFFLFMWHKDLICDAFPLSLFLWLDTNVSSQHLEYHLVPGLILVAVLMP